jgi:hypothetical protein
MNMSDLLVKFDILLGQKQPGNEEDNGNGDGDFCFSDQRLRAEALL